MSTPKRWEIFLINHSHIDIGYTDRQEVIADYHAQFVGQAVRYATERPGFRFTCEGFYQVEQFWKTATEGQKQAFLAAARKGDIELSAFYFHLTELLDEGHLRDTLKPAQAFAAEHGLPLEVAMACDVNGFSWAMADALYDAGVRYLSTNINYHHGGYPFNRPLTAFYWETPKGNRILVWNGFSYHRANVIGLIGGPNPIGEAGIPGLENSGKYHWVDVRDASTAEAELPYLLNGLKANGFDHDFLMLAGSGQYVDNSPVSDTHLDIAKEWNGKHGDEIYIHATTLSEYFWHIEATVADIPTFRGEWTDWWSDGVAATPQDTALFRNAQRVKRLVEALDPSFEDAKREELSRALWLYAEHTYGFSHTRLYNLLHQQIFGRKSRLALEADELAGDALVVAMRNCGEHPFTADRPLTFKVINPLPLRKRTVARLMVDFWEGLALKPAIRVVDGSGNTIPHQLVGVPRGWHVVVSADLGPSEAQTFTIETVQVSQDSAQSVEGRFENEFYVATWSDDGGIVSLVDKASGREMLNGEHPLGLPIQQTFPGVNRAAVANARNHDVSALTLGKPFEPKVNKTEFPDSVAPGKCLGGSIVENGQVFASVSFTYELPGAATCELIATFYHALPQIELTLRMLKNPVTDPEGMYCAFPFAVEEGKWLLDKPGGPILPGADQLPGTCCDYYLVQSGAALVGNQRGVAVTSLDAALVHIGALRLWTFTTEIEPTGTLYSWLTNNKWETNFALTSHGPMEFRYVIEITSPGEALSRCQNHTLPAVVMRSEVQT